MIFSQIGTIVLLFMLDLLGKQRCGGVQCYICVWMLNSEGQKAMVDNCRPGKLDFTSIVDSCPHGCYLTIIHEYEPERNVTRKISQSSNCTDKSFLSNSKSNVTMTLFARRCSEKPVTRDHCYIATMAGFRSEERYCHSNYCNGENGGGTTVKGNLNILVFIISPIILLINRIS